MTEPVEALRDGEPVIAVGVGRGQTVTGAQLIHPEDVPNLESVSHDPEVELIVRADEVLGCADKSDVEAHIVTLDKAQDLIEALGYCLVQAHDGDGHPDGLTGALHDASHFIGSLANPLKPAVKTEGNIASNTRHAYEAVTGEEVNG